MPNRLPGSETPSQDCTADGKPGLGKDDGPALIGQVLRHRLTAIGPEPREANPTGEEYEQCFVKADNKHCAYFTYDNDLYYRSAG